MNIHEGKGGYIQQLVLSLECLFSIMRNIIEKKFK